MLNFLPGEQVSELSTLPEERERGEKRGKYKPFSFCWKQLLMSSPLSSPVYLVS